MELSDDALQRSKSALSNQSEFRIDEAASLDEKRQVYEVNKSIYEGQFGATEKTEEDFADFIEEMSNESLWKVAYSANTIAGFVITKPIQDNIAEIMEVSVLPEFRRKGG